MDQAAQMGLDLNVGMKLDLKLSPQMIQSLKLLQVTALQLEAVVTQELETNPLLEKDDDIKEEKKTESAETDGSSSDTRKDDDGEFKELKVEEKSSDNVDWESFFEDGFDPGYRRSEEQARQEDRFERIPIALRSLQDHLLFQLIYRHNNPKVRVLVEYLINSLDDDGYLKTDIDNRKDIQNPIIAEGEDSQIREIQELIINNMPEVQASRNVREAFNVLRSLDPPGIGARDLRECLLIQMNRTGKDGSLAYKIVEEEFPLLEKLKVLAIAKKMDITPEKVQEALKEVGTLEPKPGRIFNQAISTPIIPDLIVDVIEGEIVLFFNDRFTPSLRISRNYSKLLKRGSNATSEEKKYVRDKLNSASWLIRAIEQRKSTMMKVMHEPGY
jgi:RNA polymerase sigma-54 factor